MKFENSYRVGVGAERAVGFAREKGSGVLVGRTAWIGGFSGHCRVLAEVVVNFDHEADRVLAEVRVPRPEGGFDVRAMENLGPCGCGDAYFAAAIAIMLAHASGDGLETAVFMPESVLSP